VEHVRPDLRAEVDVLVLAAEALSFSWCSWRARSARRAFRIRIATARFCICERSF
jgi:hypothetical protein